MFNYFDLWLTIKYCLATQFSETEERQAVSHPNAWDTTTTLSAVARQFCRGWLEGEAKLWKNGFCRLPVSDQGYLPPGFFGPIKLPAASQDSRTRGPPCPAIEPRKIMSRAAFIWRSPT